MADCVSPFRKASPNALVAKTYRRGTLATSFAMVEPSWDASKRSWRDCRPGPCSPLLRTARTVTPRTKTAIVNPDITGSQSIVPSGSCRTFFAIPPPINSADGLPPIDASAPQPLRGQRNGMTRRSQGRSRRNAGPRRTSRSARPPSLPHAILRPLSFLPGSWHRRPEEICNALSAPFEIPRGFARSVGPRPADTSQFAPPARWQVREGRTGVSERKNIGLPQRGAANPGRAWPERRRPVAGGNACPVIASPLLYRARGVPISRFPQA